MSSPYETYIDIGKTCIDQLELTFKSKMADGQRHKNKIVNLSRRVQHLCNQISKKKVNIHEQNTVISLINLNKELYRAILAEEPPVIEGHNLHIAISLLERICILMAENSCMSLVQSAPRLR